MALLGLLLREPHAAAHQHAAHPTPATSKEPRLTVRRAVQRFASQTNMLFATQSLLYALGIGASAALPASAAINWMMKEGLGKLARMTVATTLAQDFDSQVKACPPHPPLCGSLPHPFATTHALLSRNTRSTRRACLQRTRFVSAIFFVTCLGADYLTPYLPHLFVLLAGIANIGKAVSITAYASTQPAIMRSFSRDDNIAAVTARCQAQNMLVDQAAILLGTALTFAVRHNRRLQMLLPLVRPARACSGCHHPAWLPRHIKGLHAGRRALALCVVEAFGVQVMYPMCALTDIALIYRDIKSIHFRTVNRERAEILADHFLECGHVLSPAHVADREAVFLSAAFDRSELAVRFVPLSELCDSLVELEATAAGCQGNFVLQLRRRRPKWPWGRRGWYLGIALHKDATHTQIFAAVLAACAVRRQLLGQACRGLQMGHLCGQAPEGSREWWDGGQGRASVEAWQCVQASAQQGLRHVDELREALSEHGWICHSFTLGSAERVRFSTQMPRSIGGVRWVSFH